MSRRALWRRSLRGDDAPTLDYQGLDFSADFEVRHPLRPAVA